MITNAYRVFAAIKAAGEPVGRQEIMRRAGLTAKAVENACKLLVATVKVRNVDTALGRGKAGRWAAVDGAVVCTDSRGKGRGRSLAEVAATRALRVAALADRRKAQEENWEREAAMHPQEDDESDNAELPIRVPACLLADCLGYPKLETAKA